LKIWRTAVVKGEGSPGTILSYDKKGIVVACGAEALQLLELQLEGKRKMTVAEFSCGIAVAHLSFIAV
ncbi:MAG: methionyl-tRNA formyltransferase, partial [Parachlamydiaceae bacterium]